jgi:NAD(P)-dependent dehydrogenase (short-subunit alcohol dehydrogenase family)
MVIAMRMGQYAPMLPRTALVTGSASGIGAAIVDLLRDEGAEVQALDLADGFDVSDPQAWETVGAVELACLNAGVTTGEHDVSRLSDDAYRRILGANLDGVVFGVRRLADVMEPGSAIVATASLAGLVPSPADPIYTLTKHAVVGFIRSVAPQLEERGIRINAVAPGFVETPLIDTVPFSPGANRSRSAFRTCPARATRRARASAPRLASLAELPALARRERFQDAPAHDHPMDFVGPVVDVRAACE